MGIKINLYPYFHQYTNSQQVAEVNGGTVGQCLDHLVKQFPTIKQELFHKRRRLQEQPLQRQAARGKLEVGW